LFADLRTAIDDFLARETSGGFLLMAAAMLALVAVNSPLEPYYSGFLRTPVELRFGAFAIAKPLLLWINDGLMAVFFFLVGLEVKREIVQGELSSLDKAGLPLAAAIGGMAVPALVFVVVNQAQPANLAGWAIPAATDIAFALGVLALLGKRVPAALKILLLAVAIIDDIGAIAIIAVFYTAEVSALALALSVLGIVVLFALNRSGVTRIAPYVLVGIFLWACVLKSGVHATLAGVITALAVPLRNPRGASPLEQLEHNLHPWIAFAVLPLFAFANAGVSFAGLRFADLLAPLPSGIALGLVVGKQVGVFGAMLLAIRFGLARLPAGVSWVQLWGLACLTGIGFTMSLFIGSLAFDSDATMDQVKIGVLAGSLLAGLLGYLVLRLRAQGRVADSGGSA
jgi:Na+:H+ antiporter, NhaA family